MAVMGDDSRPAYDPAFDDIRRDLRAQGLAIETLRESVNENREAVVRLTRSFSEHDQVEVADRRRREEIDQRLTAAIEGLRASFETYQIKMQPVEDSVDWIRLTKKMLLWFASLVGGGYALFTVAQKVIE